MNQLLGCIPEINMWMWVNVLHENKIKAEFMFCHLRQLAKVREWPSPRHFEIFVHAFIGARLDYCDALLSGWASRYLTSSAGVSKSANKSMKRTETNHFRSHFIFSPSLSLVEPLLSPPGSSSVCRCLLRGFPERECFAPWLRAPSGSPYGTLF